MSEADQVEATATAGEPTDAEVIRVDFAVVFDRHATAIYRYLARRAGTVLADDLLAQTFLVAFEHRDRYDTARPSARPWLYGIASNLLRRHHRDEVRQYRAWARSGIDPLEEAGPADESDDRLDAAARSPSLARGLATLRPADREVLLLFAWGELSYDEIATALDIPLGTVRSRLHRARAHVRAALPDVHEGD